MEQRPIQEPLDQREPLVQSAYLEQLPTQARRVLLEPQARQGQMEQLPILEPLDRQEPPDQLVYLEQLPIQAPQGPLVP